MTDVTEWKNRIIGLGKKKASQFTAHPNNWRKHPQRQRSAVRGSLDSLGWVDVVIENKTTGHVVDGHERIWNALKNGDAEVPYIEVELTEAEEAQALLSLDAIAALAETDGDNVQALLEQVQTDNADVMKFLSDFAAESGLDWNQPEERDAEPQINRAAELLEKWQVKTGDLWQIGNHRLLCGDSTKREDVERVMGGEKADMVFTDPPYGVEYEGGAGNEVKREKIEGDESGNLYMPALKMYKSFCEKHAPMYVWFAASVGKPVYDAVEEIGYEVRAMIIWNKLDAHYGAFMAQYMQKHEPCLYIVDGNSHWIGASNEVTVWDVKQPSRNEFHPTEKPIELALRAIGNHEAERVADFFVGSGTTMVASENLGRRCFAIDKEPKFCAVTLERMSTAFPEIVIKRLE